MVVLAVAGILVGFGVPAFRSFVASIRLSAATNDVLGGMLLARSEAARRKVRVALCTSADGLACATQGGWDQGWIVFADQDNDGQRDASEPILGRGQRLSGGLRITGNQPVARYISYTPLGNTRLVSGAFQSGTLTFCDTSEGGRGARQIVLSADGRPRVQRNDLAGCG